VAEHRPPRHESRDQGTRDPETRARDHDQIDRLADDLLPDLIERLTTTGLGEIEVREDDWRIRLRFPGGAAIKTDGVRATADRTDRAAERGTDRTADRAGRAAAERAATEGPGDLHVGSGARGGNGTGPASSGHAAAAPHRAIAISPAVGIFQPRPEVRTGARVRQGDRIGTVDLLGVPQDVVAPEDGVVVETLAETGEGVEYGQDLVVIEPSRGRHNVDAAPPPTAPVTES
jgi:biotin carboxyl carrier protein